MSLPSKIMSRTTRIPTVTPVVTKAVRTTRLTAANSAFFFSVGKAGPSTPASFQRKCVRGLLQQAACHHDPLDFAGPFVDLGDLGVPEIPLDREVLDVSDAAVDL